MSVTASFPYFTNLPKDVVTNTIHVVTAEPDGPDKDAVATEMASRLQTFYFAIYTTVTGYAANHVQWADGIVRVFDLSEPPTRVPAIAPLVVAATGSSTTVAPETAVVMSYRSALISGVPQQRLYNRIYLGGIGHSAIVAGSTTTFPTVNSAFRTTVANAALALHAENDGTIDWIQYSTTDATPRPIVAGFINNEIDTQRRRGVSETGRTTFVMP